MFNLFNKKRRSTINSINISTEGILIDGNKIHITGEITIDNNCIPEDAISRKTLNRISELENKASYLSKVTKVEQAVYDAHRAVEVAEGARIATGKIATIHFNAINIAFTPAETAIRKSILDKESNIKIDMTRVSEVEIRKLFRSCGKKGYLKKLTVMSNGHRISEWTMTDISKSNYHD